MSGDVAITVGETRVVSLTPAQSVAVLDLADRLGSGVIDRAGRLVAGGERLGADAATWLRLVTEGLLEATGPSRLRLTTAGQRAAVEIRKARVSKTHPERIHSVPLGATRAPMLDEEES